MENKKVDVSRDRKKIFKKKVDQIKLELKNSMKKSYSSEMAEFVISLDILSELFVELEHTLVDIDKEMVNQANTENIESSCKNYLEITLQQLSRQKDSLLIDEIAQDMMALLLKETQDDQFGLGEFESRNRSTTKNRASSLSSN